VAVTPIGLEKLDTDLLPEIALRETPVLLRIIEDVSNEPPEGACTSSHTGSR
jgi:hypothetical protein